MPEFDKETGLPTGWLVEKSEIAGQYAARLVDLLKEAALPEGMMDQFGEQLHPMLYDLTKIIASVNSADGSWDSDVAQRILENGTDGFRQFMGRVREMSKDKGGGWLVLERIDRARLYKAGDS